MKPERIVFAIDSFKGSLSSTEAGRAAANGMKRILPDCEMIIKPLADGGEGTVAALTEGLGGELVSARVKDPLGRTISADYGIAEVSGTMTAVIEMAAAAGITLLERSELDPMRTSTYGVGQLILDALSRGIDSFIIAIGGSATNDGGAGMLEALGFEFTDREGREIKRGAAGLEGLYKIGVPELPKIRLRVACDVKNPLCGEFGCSRIFAPQKGAKPDDIEKMDKWLRHYSSLMQELFPFADPDSEGCGAAGGLGFALKCLGAKLIPGIELVMDAVGLEDAVRKCDLVVTGEGKLDSQTAMGKAPAGAARLAKRYSKPCIAFSGVLGDGAKTCNDIGIDAFFPILNRLCTEKEAMDRKAAAENLESCAEQVARTLIL